VALRVAVESLRALTVKSYSRKAALGNAHRVLPFRREGGAQLTGTGVALLYSEHVFRKNTSFRYKPAREGSRHLPVARLNCLIKEPDVTQTVLRHSGQSISLQCFPSSLKSIDACLHSASVDSDEILILELEILELDVEGDARPFDFDLGYCLLRRIQGKWVPIRVKHMYQDAVVLPFSAIRAAITLYVSNLPSNVTKTWSCWGQHKLRLGHHKLRLKTE